MSEYIEIESLTGPDPDQVTLTTNVNLTPASQAPERYTTPEEMEEGSPLAQTLSYIEGIRELQISGQTVTVTRDPGAEWHVIIADISAAVRDFFL